MYAKDIFKNHIDKLLLIKKKYPENKLVKHMLKSLWGYLCSYDKKYFLDDELEKLDISYWNDFESNSEYKIVDEQYYYVDDNLITKFIAVKDTKPYRYNFARMKPFITSYGRDYIARLIMKENILHKIVRIQTDGLVLRENHDFSNNKYYPINEDKTTGNIIFYNVNDYFHICDKCKLEYKYKIGHECKIIT
jgi:hypothetical protein